MNDENDGLKKLVAKDPEDILDCLRAFGEQSWSSIFDKTGQPNSNWLSFHLKKLINEGKISCRWIGEKGLYKILNNSDTNIKTLSDNNEVLQMIQIQRDIIMALLEQNRELIHMIHSKG